MEIQDSCLSASQNLSNSGCLQDEDLKKKEDLSEESEVVRKTDPVTEVLRETSTHSGEINEEKLSSVAAEHKSRSRTCSRKTSTPLLPHNLAASGEAAAPSNVQPLSARISKGAKVRPILNANESKHRKTAAEIDALFARLSIPKYVKGASREGKNETGNHRPRQSSSQHSRGEATKGLCANVVRTRSKSIMQVSRR